MLGGIMTAEIAILNTFGVALAADSAVTISIGDNDKKIYNSVNKVFTLSKFFPVGVMIYSNAQFMDIEWEVLIKEYRKKLGDQYFNTLNEYVDNFLLWLSETKYITDEQKDKCLINVIVSTFNKIKKGIKEEVEKIIATEGKFDDSNLPRIVSIVIDRSIEELKQKTENPDNCITREYLESKIDIIKGGIPVIFEKVPIDEQQVQKLCDFLFEEIRRKNTWTPYSGIVIAGYGESEIFPSIANMNLYGVIDKCILHSPISKASIDPSNKAIIVPFAQSEMVKSFMEGIDPFFERMVVHEIKVLCSKISDIVKEDDKSKIDEIQNVVLGEIKEFKRKIYVDPVINIVQSLPKSDLAEMAESLVNLTSFKRHVSSEAETVGGPTDVAVITKGDGFIWIKRKHYFDPALNNHFFQNYFRIKEKVNE